MNPTSSHRFPITFYVLLGASVADLYESPDQTPPVPSVYTGFDQCKVLAHDVRVGRAKGGDIFLCPVSVSNMAFLWK